MDYWLVFGIVVGALVVYDSLVVRVMRRALRRLGFKYRFLGKYE